MLLDCRKTILLMPVSSHLVAVVLKRTIPIYQKQKVAKGDYQFTKGIRGELKIPVGKIHGFRKFDKVKYLEKEYFIKGRMNFGYAMLMDIFHRKIDFSFLPKGYKTPKLSNLERISARRSCLCIGRKIIPSTA